MHHDYATAVAVLSVSLWRASGSRCESLQFRRILINLEPAFPDSAYQIFIENIGIWIPLSNAFLQDVGFQSLPGPVNGTAKKSYYEFFVYDIKEDKTAQPGKNLATLSA
jgi:hypothetical protein